MRMKYLSYVFAFIFVLVSLTSVASAWSTDTFSNGLISENLTFTGNQNITRWLQVPNTISILTQGYFNLTGFAVGTFPENMTVGLRIYYNFENTTNIIDGTNNLSVYEGAPAINTTHCKYGNCVQFKVDKNYKISANNITTYNDSYTMNFWVSVADCTPGNWFISRSPNFWSIYRAGGGALGAERNWNGSVGAYQEPVSTCVADSFDMITVRRAKINETHGNVTIWKNGAIFLSGKMGTVPSPATDILLGTDLGGLEMVGQMDEFAYWDRNLSNDEITALYDGGTGKFYDYARNATVLIGNTYTPVVLNANGTIPTTIKTPNLASIINKYLNSTYLVGTNYLIPFIFHSDTPGTLNYSNMLFSSSGIIENSQTYNALTTSGTIEPFKINITYDTGSYPALSAKLFYNNTQYTPNQVTDAGGNVILNTSLRVPTITAPTTKTFWWNFVFTNSSGGLEYYNSTNRTQTINPFQVDNCTTYNFNILNFTLFDEDDRTQLNGTIETGITFYSGGVVSHYYNNTFAFVAGSTPSMVCINQTNASLSMDYHVRYYSNVSLYVVEHKFAQKLNVTNSRQVNLYDLLDARSTSFKITLQSASLDLISGAIIDIQREYIPINQFISVESPLTDVYGSAIGHFVSEDVYYNFIVTKDGVILGTFNKQTAQCQNVVTGDCRITLNLIEASADAPDFQYYGNISVNYLWQPTARTLYMTWLTTDGSEHTVTQNVTLFDNWGNNSICSTTTTGGSGTYTCVVPAGYGNTTIISYLFSDGKYLGFSSFNLGDTAENIFGGTKVILGILMYTTLALMMIANPIMIMIGAILGMFFLVAFHIADGGSFIGNSSQFLWFVVAAGIIIYQITKKGWA